MYGCDTNKKIAYLVKMYLKRLFIHYELYNNK